MTPKIRIAPSCASSPGGTPGGTGGLPIRRHSSIGPQERRSSAINLSPPTVSSLAYLLSFNCVPLDISRRKDCYYFYIHYIEYI